MSSTVSPRATFLQLASNNDSDLLLKILDKHYSKNSYFNLEEILPVLNKKQMAEIWYTLYSICENNMVSALALGNDDDNVLCSKEDSEKAVKVLNAILTIAKMVIELNSYIPEHLILCMTLLQGLLTGFSDEQENIKSEIVQAGELWWKNNLPEKETICSNAFFYLLERSTSPKAFKTDVKRIWNMNENLLTILNDGRDAGRVWSYLEKCVVSPQYLNVEEGLKFISFLFNINESYIENLHKTIKTYLPNCTYKQAESYGKIYFRAWLNSSGDLKEKLETYCIQDLMFNAIHLPRNIPHSLSSILKKLLNYFHHQRKQHSVAILLLNLYDPIIWRSLKVANGVVRANAADIFFDVYPLENPEANVEETDEMLQKQFNLIESLLKDPSCIVRAIAILGTCTVLSKYWEEIPNDVITELLAILVRDLAFDASSADVRASVFKGFKILLDNPLTHPTVKNLLPALQNCFHDISDRVRISFCKLLLKIKQLRTLKYWDIVPIDHLMARLEMESKSIAQHIVNLLYPSYIPLSKPPYVQLERCLLLIEEYRLASRVFFQYVHQYIGFEATVNYIILLGKGLYLHSKRMLNCLNESPPDLNDVHPSIINKDDKENISVISSDTFNNICEEDNENYSPFENLEIAAGTLDAMCILWKGIDNKLREPRNKDLLKLLVSKVSRFMPTLFRFYKGGDGGDVCDSLIYLSSFLPSSSVPTYSGYCFSCLKNLPEDSTSSSYSTILESLCNHGRAADILELVSEWIAHGFNQNMNESVHKKGKSQKWKKVKFIELQKPKPYLALSFLEGLLQLPLCRERILIEQTDALTQIICQLHSAKDYLDKRFQTKESFDHCSDDFLLKAFILHNKLTILLHNNEKCDTNILSNMEELFVLIENIIEEIKLLDKFENSVLVKNEVLTEAELQLRSLGLSCLEHLVQICIDVVLIGFANNSFCSSASKFGIQLLEIECYNEKILFFVGKLMYQIAVYSLLHTENTKCVVIVSEMMSKILQYLAKCIQSNSDETAKMLTTIKPAINECLIYLRKENIIIDKYQEIIVIIMSSILAEMTMNVNKYQGFDKCEKINELPCLSYMLITIIASQGKIMRIFLYKLAECLESGGLVDPASVLAAAHLIYTLYKNRSACKLKNDDLIDIILILTEILKKYDDISEPVDDSVNVDQMYIKSATSIAEELKSLAKAE